MINSVILLSVLIYSILFWIWNLRKCPPGPRKLPLIGSVPFISLKNGILDWILDPAVTANKLSMVMLGPLKINVLNDFDLVKVKITIYLV